MVGGQGESFINWIVFQTTHEKLSNWMEINIFNLQFSIVSLTGNVMSHHKTIKDLEQYYSNTMADNKDVKNFLKNITSDKEG